MKQQYILKPFNNLDLPTKQRIKEVKFFLFINQLIADYSINDTSIIALIENLCRIFGTRVTPINLAISIILNPRYAPAKEEIIIASKYLGIPVRDIQKITGISNNTYYAKLEEHIQNLEPPLTPRLTKEQAIEADIFMKKATVMFKNISKILNCEVK